MNLSSCGIDCDSCKYSIEKGCPGCHMQKGKPFWGECELYQCASDRNIKHCGECNEFPCDELKKWASSENPERIQNLIDYMDLKDSE